MTYPHSPEFRRGPQIIFVAAVLAGVLTQGARPEVRYAETDVVKERKVDASAYGYFVYFQLSRDAGANLMPISASVSYRLP